MPGGKRLWRTADGALVEDGDPKAVYLAYGVDDDLEGDDVGGTIRPSRRGRSTKKASVSRNKQAAKPEDKSADSDATKGDDEIESYDDESDESTSDEDAEK